MFAPSLLAPGRTQSAPTVGAGTAMAPATGFVFVQGHYLQPPYRLSIERGNIWLNGSMISALPRPPAPVTDAAPASPKTAYDVLDVTDAWLRKLYVAHRATPGPLATGLRSELVAMLRSYPFVTKVTDAGDAITIQDRAGREATEELDFADSWTPQAAMSMQKTQLQSWHLRRRVWTGRHPLYRGSWSARGYRHREPLYQEGGGGGNEQLH